MSNAGEYEQAIKQAKENLTDLRERGTDAIGESWADLRKELFTTEEIAAGDLRVAMMIELANARKERGISQKKLEELSGVKQPVIARMERGSTSPQIDTVLKVLAPLGKTLAIVPLKAYQLSDESLGEPPSDDEYHSFESREQAKKWLASEANID